MKPCCFRRESGIAKGLVLVIVGFLIASGIVVYALRKQTRFVSPESLLPQGLPIVLRIDVPTIWNSLKPLHDQEGSVIRNAFAEFERESNPERDFFSWAGQGVITADVAMALFVPQINLVAAIQATNQAAAANALQKLRASLEKSAGKFTEEDYQGTRISSMPGRPPQPGFAYAMVGGCVILASSHEHVKQVVDVFKGEKPALDKSEAWATLKNKALAAPTLMLAADLTSLTAKFPVPPGAGAHPLQSLREAGWYLLSFVAERDRTRIQSELTGGAKLAADMKRRMGGGTDVMDESTIRRLPKATLGFVTAKNLAGIYRAFRETLKQVAANIPASADVPLREFDRAIEEANAELGINVEEDIVGWLTGETTIGITGFDLTMPRLVVQLQGPNATIVESKVRTLREALQRKGLTFATDATVGQGVERLELPPVPNMPANFGVWYMVRNDTLIVATSQQAMKDVLTTQATANAGIAAQQNYMTLREGLPKRLATLIYLDVVPTLEQVATLAPGSATGAKEAAALLKGSPGAAVGIASAEEGSRSVGIVGAPMSKLLEATVKSPETMGPIEGTTFALSAIPAPGALGATSASAIAAAVMFPTFARAREKARQAACTSNLKQIGMATMMYLQDYDNVFPKTETWHNDLMPFVKNAQLFQCPAAGSSPSPHYAMNPKLSGIRQAEIAAPQETILYFDADASGKPAFRHSGLCNATFADGHVKGLRALDIKPGMWTPEGND